jgi:hypothetical protein
MSENVGMRRALAALLAVLLAAQPAAAGAQKGFSAPVRAPLSVPAASVPALTLPALPASLALPGASLIQALPSLPPGSRVSAALPSASAAAPKAASAAKAGSPKAAAAAVAKISAAAAQAVENLPKASGAQASGQAALQFAQLSGDVHVRAAAAASLAKGVPAAGAADGGGQKGGPPAPEPPKKSGFFRVFADPARNASFWRYMTGYSVFLLGFQMYIVGMPYLISSMTANSLREHNDARAGSAEAVKELVRSNRSLSRIAHWVSQGVSYALIPLFTRNDSTEGPRKWLVRSMLLRAAALGLVPVVFFTTGLMSLQASMIVLFALIAAHAFFQGIAVTKEAAATAKLFGHKSVTPEERTRANSIITVVAAVFAIIGPAIAGQIASIGPVLGKQGAGGAIIYGIYAGAIALAGLIYATVKLFGAKADAAKPGDGGAAVAQAPKGVGGTLKNLWSSIKDGTRLVFKDRLLRTMVLLTTISSLFSDPLVFNVLPEYVEKLAAGDPGQMGAILNIPVLGAFIKSLLGTPMGNFALMVAMASVGSIVAAALVKPMTKLFRKLGFKTDEALTIPFYFLAALELPLFLLMMNTPSLLGVVALYGLQALSVGFIGIAISGLYQKNLGSRKDGEVNKVLAATSLIGIVAAIISTFVYGFVLKGIAIETALLIAAIATGAASLLRLAAPFLMFSKDQRKPPADKKDPPDDDGDGEAPANHLLPSSGDGPNQIQSVRL